MKKPFLRDLSTRLLGTVTDAPEALDYFATDASIFTMRPTAIVYPKNTADVRRTVGFAAERTTAGKPLSVVARGKGTDQSGGAIGDGLEVVFPAYMNRLLHMDRDTVTVQPGMTYHALQQILQAHGRWLPPYPTSSGFASIGGAVANNAGGEKSLKYGTTRQYVKRLKVVLSDGSLIETKRISARELSRKKGQSDLEGAIYRKIDALVLDNQALVTKSQPKTTKNAAGYALNRVRGSAGSFDLSQLFVGSQGTLGIITEMTLATVPWNPSTSLVVGYFDDLDKAGEAAAKLVGLKPSALEMVDGNLLEYLRQHEPGEIEGLVPDKLPEIVLLVEFDDHSQLQQTLKLRRASGILKRFATSQRVATDTLEQEALWKIRRSAAAVVWMTGGAKKALPVIEDGVVPVAKLSQFLTLTYRLLAKHGLNAAVWGHAGDGNLHLQPFLDLGKPKDVDKIFALASDFYDIVVSLGGSTSGGHNDGMMRGPYLRAVYGDQMYELFEQVKTVCDPHNILNPGKKIGVTEADVRPYVRRAYSLNHLYDHLPYT
jgi:FAD/FMN-containing dehydrogenase